MRVDARANGTTDPRDQSHSERGTNGPLTPANVAFEWLGKHPRTWLLSGSGTCNCLVDVVSVTVHFTQRKLYGIEVVSTSSFLAATKLFGNTSHAKTKQLLCSPQAHARRASTKRVITLWANSSNCIITLIQGTKRCPRKRRSSDRVVSAICCSHETVSFRALVETGHCQHFVDHEPLALDDHLEEPRTECGSKDPQRKTENVCCVVLCCVVLRCVVCAGGFKCCVVLL